MIWRGAILLTINAMAWSPVKGFCDPFGGAADLEAGILRCVGEAEQRFSEDALRILRALRFSAQLGFPIDEAAQAAMRKQKSLLDYVSGERIYSELCKLLAGEFARDVLLQYPDILGVVMPEILPMVGFDQHNPHHCYDVWTHSVTALQALDRMCAAQTDEVRKRDFGNDLRWAALLHDVGKPCCYAAGADGVGHFYGHAAASVDIARGILSRLKVDHKTREMVLRLIRYHDGVIPEEKNAVRRWLSRKGEQTMRKLMWLKRADNLGQTSCLHDRQEEYKRLQALIDEIVAENECISLKNLEVNGNDLLAAGIPKGPAIGAALRRLLLAVLSDEVENEREALLALIKEKTVNENTENRNAASGNAVSKNTVRIFGTVDGQTRCAEVVGSGQAADLIRRSGLHFDFPCGGTGKCGKCRIRVTGAAKPCTEQEIRLLSPKERADGVRLACFCHITGAAEIHFLQSSDEMILDWAAQAQVGSGRAAEPVGLACDIGTTTVAMWLVGLQTGTVLASVTEANCQRAYGADVISRVSACRKYGTAALSETIRRQIGEMAARCLAQAGKPEPEKMVVTGNSVMLHIFENLDPQSLAVSPFELQSGFGTYSAQPLVGVPVYLPGCIGAFAGADLLCAVLASGMVQTAQKEGKPCLLADVGTNGEMALAKPDGTVLCCSAPAGPAFEGANISCGMNASRGAISALKWNKKRSERPEITVIGDGAARGLCGSGLLDCVAFMLENGALDETGYLPAETDYEIPGTAVRLTQTDIRQVQMAKAAVCAGIRALLCRGETTAEEIGAFYLAGGFGSYLDLDSAVEIGLFPEELRAKAHFIGNGALAGAAMILRDPVAEKKAAAICGQAEELQLAKDACFTEQYIREMNFAVKIHQQKK